MSYSYVFSRGDKVRHAGEVTTAGWQLYCDWAETLPVEEFEQMVQMQEHGYINELDAMEKQLSLALKEKRPKSKATREVAQNLLVVLRERSDAEVFGVTGEVD
jgi:hypothetical protein